MRRYTLVYHHYIGYGSYVIEFKRIRCEPSKLSRFKKGDLHFVISGWPNITHPNDEMVFESSSKAGSSWYCHKCQVEVHETRCQHCGKSKREKT